jgi:hypothetical protein
MDETSRAVDRLLSEGVELQALGQRAEPLWAGPCSTGRNGGITGSLLGRYLVCKERFRVQAIEGLRPAESFSHRLYYGLMWHTCEEAFAKDKPGSRKTPAAMPWQESLKQYCQALCRRFPTAQEQIDHWYEVCKRQFPVYIRYWARQQDVLKRTPVVQEHTFDVQYKLPSGRTVRLRGKWDAMDLIQ